MCRCCSRLSWICEVVELVCRYIVRIEVYVQALAKDKDHARLELMKSSLCVGRQCLTRHPPRPACPVPPAYRHA